MSALALLLLAAEPAQPTQSPWQLTLEAQTQAPLDVGVRFTAETPFRLQLTTSLGVVVGPYVQLINDILVDAGAYNQATANLINAVLQRSLAFQANVGYRPLENWGFYFGLGYELLAVGGTTTGPSALAAASGNAAPTDANGRQFDVKSALHILNAEVGYCWRLWDRLQIRAALAGIYTFAASTSVNVENPTGRPATQQTQAYASDVATYLDNTYTSYVISPLVTVGVGYAF